MFKNENGFSLVELAIAAGLAVALAATAVTILSGTTASLSSKANGAAGTSTTYNSDVLANASGAAGGSSSTANMSAVFTKGTDFGMGSSSQMYDRTFANNAQLQFYTPVPNSDAAAAVLALKAGDTITASFTVYPGGTQQTGSATVISVSDQGYQVVVTTEMFNIAGASWGDANTIQFTYN